MTAAKTDLALADLQAFEVTLNWHIKILSAMPGKKAEDALLMYNRKLTALAAKAKCRVDERRKSFR